MGLIGNTSPDPYAGLGIFRPPSYEQSEAAQNAKDQKQSADTVALCEKVKNFAAGRISALEAFESWLQIQKLPIDTNRTVELETSRVNEKGVSDSAGKYQGDVSGWAGGIQQVRSILAHNAPTDQDALNQLRERAKFPEIPQVLADYIATNNLG